MEKMSYQDAKKIRAKSFGDIMANKLAEGQGIGSSFGATLSEKSAAKMKGFKEKFDPMNIAKFVTGGSKLGPALLGRLTNRDSKDIKYFAGVKDKRNDTATKLEGGNGGFAANNQMIESLLEIYDLLKDSEENKKKDKERESQFAEENTLEKERNKDRRHKELMKAITGKPYETATKVSDDVGGGLLDGIGGLPMPGGRKKSPGFRGLAKALGFVGLAFQAKDIYDKFTGNDDDTDPTEPRTVMDRINQAGLAATTIPLALSGIANKGMKNMLGKSATYDTKSNRFKNEKGKFTSASKITKSAKLEKYLVELQKFATKASKKGWIMRIVSKITTRLGLSIGLKIAAFLGGLAATPFTAGISTLLSVASGLLLAYDIYQIYDAIFGPNGIEEELEKEDADLNKSTKSDNVKPGEMQYDEMGNPTGYATPEPITPKKASVQESFVDSYQKESTAFAQRNTPPAIETPTVGQKLESVQAENLNFKIQEKTAVGKTVVNNAVIKSAMESAIIDGPLLPVRNMEESYQDMIFYSTRIV